MLLEGILYIYTHYRYIIINHHYILTTYINHIFTIIITTYINHHCILTTYINHIFIIIITTYINHHYILITYSPSTGLTSGARSPSAVCWAPWCVA